MMNQIIEAISVSLNEAFGDKYEIHRENVEQDLQEPCFFIISIKPESDLYFGKKYKKKAPFCIQYFPETEEKMKECYDTAEKLEQCLEYISVAGDLMHGRKISYEVQAGILYFFVNYDYFVYRAKETEKMETLEAKVSAGGN